MKPNKPCSYCGQPRHNSLNCYIKPKNRVLPKKKMRRIGKHGREWLKTRAEWFEAHPAEYYFCYIDGERLTKNETTLDHIQSRSRHPELRYDLNNLAPCCFKHNKEKGSMSLDEYLNKLEGSKWQVQN